MNKIDHFSYYFWVWPLSHLDRRRWNPFEMIKKQSYSSKIIKSDRVFLFSSYPHGFVDASPSFPRNASENLCFFDCFPYHGWWQLLDFLSSKFLRRYRGALLFCGNFGYAQIAMHVTRPKNISIFRKWIQFFWNTTWFHCILFFCFPSKTLNVASDHGSTLTYNSQSRTPRPHS